MPRKILLGDGFSQCDFTRLETSAKSSEEIIFIDPVPSGASFCARTCLNYELSEKRHSVRVSVNTTVVFENLIGAEQTQKPFTLLNGCFPNLPHSSSYEFWRLSKTFCSGSPLPLRNLPLVSAPCVPLVPIQSYEHSLR